jgi:4,5-dihydroxyphthalate decarboxylase
MNMLTALEEAKRRSLERARDANAPRFPVPFAPAHFERMTAEFGEDPWPYGIEPNRVTLEWFLERAYEQSVCATKLEPEDLFPPEVRDRFRV